MKDKNHVPMKTQPKDKEAGGTNGPVKTSDSGVTSCQEKSNTKSEEHVIYVTKYGSDLLPGMRTIICNEANPTDKHRRRKVEALADSGATHSIISLYMAKQINMTIFGKGSATLTDASNKSMDVTGRGELTVQEESGFPYKIQVLVSKDLGNEELDQGKLCQTRNFLFGTI